MHCSYCPVLLLEAGIVEWKVILLPVPLAPQQLVGRFVNTFPINPSVPSVKAVRGEQWSPSLSSLD